MAQRKREAVLHVRLMERELEMVREIVEIEGLTTSEWVRTVVRREHLLTFGRNSRKKPTKQ